MPEYKCISCGEVKENDTGCSCPVCGYRMFEIPFDREVLLKKEIQNFVCHLRQIEILNDSFEFFREGFSDEELDSGEKELIRITKEKDDERFPTFEMIQRYVCASAKTEVFFERLNNSILQIQNHIRTAYRQQYKVGLEGIKLSIEETDVVLNRALNALGIKVDYVELNLPKITLDYSETPDEKLLPIAESILTKVLELSRKILRFIKQNNIYGAAYRKVSGSKFSHAGKKDYSAKLLRCKEKLSRVLAKKYMVDLLSDGYDELEEMLKVLWNAIEAILMYPVLVPERIFTLEDGMELRGDELNTELLKKISLRYLDVDAMLQSDDFLAEKSEDDLFELYSQMIELDEDGFMGTNKQKLFKIGKSEKKLNELIGLAGIKESVKKIKAYALMNQGSDDLNLHMCFLGNPGSGKTEVARLIADILYENKILPTNQFVEVDRSGLVSQYFGATAEKTRQVIQKAMGGVLFIDEAYALGNGSESGGTSDYGKEAIDTLVKAMEDHRGKFCVILAGYRNEMQKMMSVNPGFRSRIQFTLDFPNYSREELKAILLLMLGKRSYTMGDAALNRILDITDIKRKEPNFANAREIRNILDQVIMCQNLRCAGTEDKELGLVDVNKYIQETKINLPSAASDMARKVLTGEEELEQLIGLHTVKRMVRKIKAYAKRNREQTDFNLHMCFYGNPGTGKTEVARILSRILHDANVLDEAKLVETDAHGLIGRFVGETAPKTLQKINDAMGGVLFIDEAYALTNGGAHSGTNANYGEEAIAVLLKEMEDRRGQFCTILAGYRTEMKQMLSANPGMESRIQFTLEFPDYTREELGMITKFFLKKKKYEITDDAFECFLDVVEYYRKLPNFANARTVRNVMDQVIMNQNLRTEDADEAGNDLIIRDDVNDYLMDEGIDLNRPVASARKIGF